MSIIQGDLVYAIAGKEKNSLFVVKQVDEKFCYIVDGKRLKLNKPKKKSLKHVQKASKQGLPNPERLIGGQENLNAEIRNFIKERKVYVETRRH